MQSSVKGARLSSFGRHGDRTTAFGVSPGNPLPTRADQLMGERVFCFPAEPVTYSRKDGHRAQNPSHGRFTKGPRLMTNEARLISVNDPVASKGKSALRRSPRSYGWIPAITGVFVRWSAPSLDASSARHGLVRKDELCPERRVSPSWMNQQHQLSIKNLPTMKKTRKRMTIEEHRKIGAWINDPTLRLISCDVANNYGKTSRSGKYARKLADLIIQLKSSMESDAYTDGHQTEATAIYYPCITDHSKLSQ
jgi:hypothetical protein